MLAHLDRIFRDDRLRTFSFCEEYRHPDRECSRVALAKAAVWDLAVDGARRFVPLGYDWKARLRFSRVGGHDGRSAAAMAARLTRHRRDHERGQTLEVDAAALRSGWLDRKLASLLPGRRLNLRSACRAARGDEIFHIPMLDFQCAKTRYYLTVVRAVVPLLGQERGSILDSGRSFHFVGFDIMTTRTWTEFLGRALMLAQIEVTAQHSRVVH